MIEQYEQYSADLSEELVSEIEKLHLSQNPADKVLGQYLKRASVNGGEDATKENLLFEARQIEEAAESFRDKITTGGDSYWEKASLNAPLPESTQRDTVDQNEGRVDEVVIVTLREIAESENPGGLKEVLSHKVVGWFGLRDVDPEVIETIGENKLVVRVQGWIPDSRFE